MDQPVFHIGQRVVLVRVNHPALSSRIGERHIIQRLVGGNFAWCRPDNIFQRRKRNGEIVHEPANWEILYSIDSLMDANKCCLRTNEEE